MIVNPLECASSFIHVGLWFINAEVVPLLVLSTQTVKVTSVLANLVVPVA